MSATAIENLPDHSQRRPVMKTTCIADGRFRSRAARRCGTTTTIHPALYVDLDGDGHCGAGDVGLAMQLYGWNQPIDDDVGVTYAWATYRPTSQLVGAIGGGDTPGAFCHDYFPRPRSPGGGLAEADIDEQLANTWHRLDARGSFADTDLAA